MPCPCCITSPTVIVNPSSFENQKIYRPDNLENIRSMLPIRKYEMPGYTLHLRERISNLDWMVALMKSGVGRSIFVDCVSLPRFPIL